MPMVGTGARGRDLLGQPRRQELEHDGEAAGIRQPPGLLADALGRLLVPPLHPVAAQGVHRLGREPDVAHDRDPGAHEPVDVLAGPLAAAFQLHRLGARLRDEPARVPDRLVGGHVEAQERHVHDQERVLHAPPDGPGMMDHVVEGDGQRGVVTQDHLAEGVAHQHHVDPGLVHQPREQVVVRRERDDGLAALLHLLEGAGRGPPAFGARAHMARSRLVTGFFACARS